MLQMQLTEQLCRVPIPFLSLNSTALTAISYQFEQVLPPISLYRKMTHNQNGRKGINRKKFLVFASGLVI